MKRLFDDFGLGLKITTIAVTLVFLMIPVLMAVAMSFDARSFLGPFPPKEFSLRWYERFFSDTMFLRGLRISLVLAVLTTCISTAIGVSAALVIDRYRFRGRDFLASFFLSPLIVPAVVIGFSLLLFFSSVGIFDGFARLLGGHIIITVPYTVRATLAGLVGSVPPSPRPPSLWARTNARPSGRLPFRSPAPASSPVRCSRSLSRSMTWR